MRAAGEPSERSMASCSRSRQFPMRTTFPPNRHDQNEDPGLYPALPTDFGLPPKGSRHVKGDVVSQESHRSLV
jgi:hypothetical protein